MMIEFQVGEKTAKGHLALPQKGEGPGVLVLHAWWGLNDFFKSLCDRLAGEGFVALAPDLYNGKSASTIDEAEQLLKQRDGNFVYQAATGAVDFLRAHPAVRGKQLGAVGFSMGGAWSMLLASERPESIAAAVIFYGSGDADFSQARAAYLGHFAEVDEWEPLDGVRQMEADMRAAGREVTFHTYPDVGHWFFESNRPDVYNAEAAQLAWERTLAFLKNNLRE
jgi:carboxymethylenebutenolidase